MSAFFVLQQRNFETGLRQRDFLKGIEILDLLLRSFVQDCVGQGEKAAARSDFVRVRSRCESFARLHFLGNAFAQLIDIYTRQIQLTDFLLQSHPAHEIVDPYLDWLLGIEIDRSVRCLRLEAYRQHQQGSDEQYSQQFSENNCDAGRSPAAFTCTKPFFRYVFHYFVHCDGLKKEFDRPNCPIRGSLADVTNPK